MKDSILLLRLRVATAYSTLGQKTTLTFSSSTCYHVELEKVNAVLSYLKSTAL